MTAINNIIQEVFSTEGSIKRIEHQNYLLIFRNIDNFIICYAYRGSSYSASKKIEQFRDQLMESTIWKEFPIAIKSGRYLEDEKVEILEKWASEIFT